MICAQIFFLVDAKLVCHMTDSGVIKCGIQELSAEKPADPAEQEKSNEQKLNELLEKGKAAGKLTSKEIMDVLDNLTLSPDELDKFYDKLENLGIDMAGDNTLMPLEDLVPDI